MLLLFVPCDEIRSIKPGFVLSFFLKKKIVLVRVWRRGENARSAVACGGADDCERFGTACKSFCLFPEEVLTNAVEEFGR